MKNRYFIHRMTLLAILIAIVLLMSFTPVGYLKIGALEITFLVVPVAIGAILLGPIGGLILGLTFGLTSFIQCLTGMSAFGATLLNINPFLTFLVCVPTRALMGFLTGLIFKGLNKVMKKDIFAHIIAAVSAPLLNTIFFMSLLCICFYRTDFLQGIAEQLKTTNVFSFIIAFIALNGLIEIGVNFIVGATVSKTIYTIYTKRNPKVVNSTIEEEQELNNI